jgi:hypothetical protein
MKENHNLLQSNNSQQFNSIVPTHFFLREMISWKMSNILESELSIIRNNSGNQTKLLLSSIYKLQFLRFCIQIKDFSRMYPQNSNQKQKFKTDNFSHVYKWLRVWLESVGSECFSIAIQFIWFQQTLPLF